VFVESFKSYLGQKLVGVYLHGSLAMGCFNPASSDVDVLVVVADKLNRDEKRTLSQLLLQISGQVRLEMSVVTLQSLQTFYHPSLYELHFSGSNKEGFERGYVDLTTEKTDPDLAAHFVITKARGICLYGQPIVNVFPDFPKRDYLDSIVTDAETSYKNIVARPDEGECSVPTYGVLNFCRILAFMEQGLMMSKLEGGHWGVEHLPVQYRPVIQEALEEYQASGTADRVDCKLLKQFANYARAEIQRNSK